MTPRIDHQDTLYRYSSLARPLDPSWPTNRAVLIIMPVAAAVLALVGPLTPGLIEASRAWAAASGAAAVLGAWALARELAPDDQRGAFVAMACGLAALVLVPSASLVLLFTTLTLTRMLSRSVGLPARTLDGTALLVLTGWSMASTRSLGVGLVVGAGFAADAVLPGGLRRQWGFAAMCFALVGFLAVTSQGTFSRGAPSSAGLVAQALGVVLFLVLMLRTRDIESTGDATGTPLSTLRVRSGMAAALAMAVQAPLFAQGPAGSSALVWAAIIGVSISGVAPPGQKPDGA